MHAIFDWIWGSVEESQAYERPSTGKIKNKSMPGINSEYKKKKR